MDQAPEEEASSNQISGSLRSCYVNEVKSAKELKISIKGEHVYFFPNIQYTLRNASRMHLMDFRTRKP